jgi:hypothetical protein
MRGALTLAALAASGSAAEAAAMQPAPEYACEQIVRKVEDVLAVELMSRTAPFEIGALKGESCQTHWEGDGLAYDTPSLLAESESRLGGWAPDESLVADGTGEARRGYRQGKLLIVITLGWNDAPGAGLHDRRWTVTVDALSEGE